MNTELADDLSRRIEETVSFPEWKKWFALLSVMISVLTISLLGVLRGGSTLTVADWALYGSLFALAISALYANFLDARTIDREIRLASRDIRMLVELNDIALFLDKTQPRAHGNPANAPADDFSKPSYFRTHIDSLYKIYCVSSQINQDNLIEILHTRLLAKNRKVELHASILITVGLIGTIVGLLLMMGQLKTTVSGDTLAQGGNMLKELMGNSGPLAGLGTAFLTTLIAACFGGVMLRVLTSIVEEGTTKYVALVSELSEIYVLPMLRSHASTMEQHGARPL